MKAVITDNLSKTYTGGKKAVDNISFTLNQGEVFGFLGPNGAGKTTAVKLLNGMISPTGGHAVYLIWIHLKNLIKFISFPVS